MARGTAPARGLDKARSRPGREPAASLTELAEVVREFVRLGPTQAPQSVVAFRSQRAAA
ncbi:hypothetical protein ACTMTU_04855 [Streptomyces sp. OZ13]|uniref:hypothetical protein n=1 Tax=Streptomyces sp. OZ13 TaxID=3452210 RepID=UPI003F8AF6DA